MKKISEFLRRIFALCAVLLLFVGGAAFFGFAAALFIGGDTAEAICIFIYERVFKVLIYGASFTTLIGLLSIYLKKEKFMTFS